MESEAREKFMYKLWALERRDLERYADYLKLKIEVGREMIFDYRKFLNEDHKDQLKVEEEKLRIVLSEIKIRLLDEIFMMRIRKATKEKDCDYGIQEQIDLQN